MSLRALALGPPPQPGAPIATKVDWLIKSMVAIQQWSNDNSAANIAQGFAIDPANLIETRVLDPTTASATDAANVLGTLLSDLARGGAKRR